MKAARQAGMKQASKTSRAPVRQPAPRSPLAEPVTSEVAFIQPKCACGGGCPSCRDKIELQTKLAVSAPGDVYEQEADRVAAEVMRMPDTAAAAPASAPGITPLVQRLAEPEPETEEEEIVQPDRAPGFAPAPPSPPSLGAEIQALRGAGRPLPDGDRSWFEQRFHRDFRGVRIHTGAQADRAARSINALAFAAGRDVIFRSGHYAPGHPAGRRLLAHELAHVVQQGRAPPVSTLQRSAADQPRAPPAFEIEGDGSEFLQGGSPLPANVREFYEPRLGRDLSDVRVHTDARAAEVSESLAAQAFTYKNHIWFSSGSRPAPSRLLAHELVHVVQQTGGTRPAVQRTPASAAAAVPAKYRPVHWGPLYGTNMHVDVFKELRAANGELVTEAPIPGTNKKTPSHDALGEADLYKSDPASTVAGVRGTGDGSATPPEYADLPLGKAVNPKTAKRSPTWDAGTNSIVGSFVKRFWVGDLKPASRSEVRSGNKQLKNYIQHFEAWARKLSASPPHGDVLPVGDGSGATLKLPDPINYKRFDTEKSKTGGIRKAKERIWVYALPNHPGIYLYFDLPADYQQQNVAGVIVKLDEHLEKLNKPMKQKPPKVGAGPAKVQKLPAVTAAPRRGMIQRKVPPDNVGEWKEEHKKWSADVDKAFKEYGGTVRKLYFDDIFDLPSSAPQLASAARTISKLDLWAGTTGTILGTLGWRFRGAIARFHPFFEKVKKKFDGFRTRAGNVKASTSRNWVFVTFNAFLKAAKQFFSSILDQAFSRFTACINGIVDGAFNKLTEQFDNLDVDLEFLKPIEDVTKQFEEFEDKVKKYFEDLEEQFEEFIKFIQESKDVIALINTLRWPLRLILQAISCGTPPAWGCLWGLVGQLALDQALNLGMRYISQTATFQRMVNDLACSALKDRLNQWYGGLIRSSVELAGLDKFADEVGAPCKPGEMGPEPPCDLPVTGLSEGEYDKLRGELETNPADMQEIVDEVTSKFDMVPGVPAEPRHVQYVVDLLREANVSIAKLQACLDGARQGDRYTLQNLLECLLAQNVPPPPQPPSPPPPPPPMAGGGGGGQRPDRDGSHTSQGPEPESGEGEPPPPPPPSGRSPESAPPPPGAESESDREGGAGAAGGEGATPAAPPPLSGDTRESLEGLINEMLEHYGPEDPDAERLRRLRDQLREAPVRPDEHDHPGMT